MNSAPSRRGPSSSQKRTSGKLFAGAIAGVVIALGVFGALAWQRLEFARRQTPAATTAAVTPIGADAASIEQALQSANGRPVYRYSVVPGGVRSPEEMLEAMARDKVVKEHYEGMDPTKVRVERLAKPITAHVSYRIADRVYWTKKPVTIPAGEKILTDGKRMLRCRCGNGISVDPLLPTLDTEPDTGTFDALVAPLTVSQAPLDPKLSYYTPPHLNARGVPTPSSSTYSNPPGNPPYGMPPGGLPPPGGNPPGGNPPGNPPSGDPPTTTPPPGNPPPGDPPPGDPPPGDPPPPGNPPPGFPPPPGNPPGDPPPPGNPPPTCCTTGDIPPPPPPTPVPEPSTGLLIASGVGWLLARRLRKQQDKRKAEERAQSAE